MNKQRWVLAELDRRLEDAVTTYTSRVLELQDYREGLVEAKDIRATARESFRGLIDHAFLEAPGTAGHLVDIASKLVRRRRDRGVRLDPLLTAVRLDFTVLWELLQRICRPNDVEILVDLADPLWRAVEDYANGVYRAYLELAEQETREQSMLRQEALAQALHPDAGPETMRQAAELVGFAEDEELVLCVASGEVGRELRGVMSIATRQAEPVHVVNHEGYTVLIFPARLRSVRELVAEVPCAVLEGLHGLDAVRSAVTLGQRIAAVMGSSTTSLTPDRAWPRVARRELESLGLDLAADVEAGLARARHGEAERLKATVRAYLESGSVAAAAEAIPCHRNTVQNHLNRFGELTGIDPGIPAQAARLVVAWG